ncbi:hypothetical protein HG531_004608 [Fusarium graminearum]|nr:hypothetical protein HG531_004608 [Fusarium graminearum]
MSVVETKTEAVELEGSKELGIFVGKKVFEELVEKEVVLFLAEDLEKGGSLDDVVIGYRSSKAMMTYASQQNGVAIRVNNALISLRLEHKGDVGNKRLGMMVAFF